MINRSNIRWQSCWHMGGGSYFVLHDNRTISISRWNTAGYIWQGGQNAFWIFYFSFPSAIQLFVYYSFSSSFQSISKRSKLWSPFPLLQIVNNSLVFPDAMNPELRNLLEGLLCKGQWKSIVNERHSELINCPSILIIHFLRCFVFSFYSLDSLLKKEITKFVICRPNSEVDFKRCSQAHVGSWRQWANPSVFMLVQAWQIAQG